MKVSGTSIGDDELVGFLRRALPLLGLRWAGFRKPRRQVRRRLAARLGRLKLASLDAYRARLAADPDEWRELDRLCRVTISRFWRDRVLWEDLGERVLPALARAAHAAGRAKLAAWSAGCASGEEPYSLALLWRYRVAADFPGLALRVVATDVDPTLLARARRGAYPAGCLRELPEAWRRAAFAAPDGEAGEQRLRGEHRAGVAFFAQDIREAAPAGPFDLILCRNLAWTYFDDATQRLVLGRLTAALRPAGFLAVGSHEVLPAAPSRLASHGRWLYVKPDTTLPHPD